MPRPELDRLIEMGLNRYSAGDLDGALLLWEEALAVDPDNAQANSYVDYVRLNFDLLSAANDAEVGYTDEVGFGIEDEPDYVIEVKAGELAVSSEAPRGLDSLDAGWFIEDDTIAVGRAEPERDSDREPEPERDPDHGPVTVELEADEPPLPAPPEVGFDDATREYHGIPTEARRVDVPTETRRADFPVSESTAEHATDGFAETAAFRSSETSAFQSDDVTAGLQASSAGFQPDDVTAGLQASSAGFQQDEVTAGFQAEAATAGFQHDEVTAGFQADAGTPGLQARAASARAAYDDDGGAYEEVTTGFAQDEVTTDRPASEPATGFPQDEVTSGFHPQGTPTGFTAQDTEIRKRELGFVQPSSIALGVAATVELAAATLSEPTTAEHDPFAPLSPRSEDPGVDDEELLDSLPVPRAGGSTPDVGPPDGGAPARLDTESLSQAEVVLQHSPTQDFDPRQTVDVTAPTRELGLRQGTTPPPDQVDDDDLPTTQSDARAIREAARHTGNARPASEGTKHDVVLPFDPIDARSAQLLDEIDEGASPDESREDATRRRITSLLDRAVVFLGDADLESAVTAVDLALSEDPNSALGQKLITRKRDTIMQVFQGFLGDLERMPQLARPLHELSNAPINPRAAFLLSRLDGTLTIEEILDVSGMPKLEAYRHLCQLFLRGILRW